jgi:hypothetical protein
MGIETFVLDQSTFALKSIPTSMTSTNSLEIYVKNLSKNSPLIYAFLSIFFVIIIGFIFSYIRELIHHFRLSKETSVKNLNQ